MKFRISGKDLVMFIIFAVMLLYLCAIITGNINSLSTTGSFSGLNPFPGLSKLLGTTILLFLIFLVIIFSGVSSYIFERKKGVGFEIGEKDNKGYSRWSKEKEMKSDKGVEEVDPLATDSQYAGIPLVNDGKRLWVDNGEYHNLVIGSTGSGKSQTIVEPMVELLIKKGESMIITDPKGELYRAASNYMRERGYNVVVLNFREPQRGNAWNPLTLPYQYYKSGNQDKATELLDDVALNILYDPNNKSGDPFWEKSAADYFSGLALGLFEDAKEREINLNTINLMSTVGEDKFAASNYIKEYFTMKGEDSSPYVFASNTINAPADTKGGILSVFRQKIRLFASRENLSEMLAYSDFDMRSIGKEKTAVFIVIHDEKTTYHGLATIFIKQCYETLIDVAQQNGGKLPFRTNFILDEFANMPPLKDVTTMVTAARSRAIRFTFIIQNFAQLKSVYGNEDAETIKGNCGNMVYLISTELSALEEISKMCGEVKSGDKDKTASTPLVTVTDLQKLKLFEAIIIRWRMAPFKTKYTPNFKMDWGHPHIEAEFPERKKEPVEMFDLKTFVKEKKRSNMLSKVDGADSTPQFGGTSPFGGGSPFGASPFSNPSSSPFSNPSSSPFSNNSNSFDAPSSNDSGLFGGLGGGLDLDQMMKDIDKKIAELDAEEARQKQEMEKKKNEEKKDVSDSDLPKLEDIKINVEPVVKDVVPEELPKIKDEKETTSFNIFDTEYPKVNESKVTVDIPSVEIKHEDEIVRPTEVSNDLEKANIAVATSSPIDDNYFDYDDLPKVEDASIIQPNYTSGSVVKPNDNNDYNIYNSIPNIMDSVKDEDDFTRIEKEKLPEVSNKLNDYNIYAKEPEVKEEIKEEIKEPVTTVKTNVNIDPDKVVINNNSIISDDEFFDDFFGDD